MWYSRVLTTEASYCFHELSTHLNPYPSNIMAEVSLAEKMEDWDPEAKRRRILLQGYPRYFSRLFERINYRQHIVGNSDSTFQLVIGSWSLWPSTKYIFSVRNGINTVQSAYSAERNMPKPILSRLEKRFNTPDFFTIVCNQWRNMIEKLEDSMVWLEKKADILTVRFEEVTGSLEGLQTVWDWLGIPNWEKYESRNIKMIQTPINARTNKKGVVQPEEIWGQWTSGQKAVFRTVCGEVMNRHGYPIPGKKPTL
jgi:hypothetical protein